MSSRMKTWVPDEMRGRLIAPIIWFVEFIILEMGMSDFNEIDLLGQISSPNISVITNIGESHLEFLKTKENVFKAKTEIIPYIKETLIEMEYKEETENIEIFLKKYESEEALKISRKIYKDFI